MTFQASKYDALDEGDYAAVLTDIETGENDYGPYRKWHFEVETLDGKREVSAMTSDASGPQSKAYAWATALLGHKPSGEEEQLRGLHCELHLVVNDQGYNRISAVLPPVEPAKGQSTLNLEPLKVDF